MGQDHLDDADVDAERHGPGALVRTLAAILDEPVATPVPDPLFPEVALQRRECRRFALTGWFPYGAHVGYRKVNLVTETVQAGHGRSARAAAPDRPGFRLGQRPFPGVVTA